MIEEDAREFIRRLPDLDQGTAHLMMLAVRSRYIRDYMNEKGSDVVLERKVIRHKGGSWRDGYFDRLLNLVALQEHGSYRMTSKETRKDFQVPHQAKAVYATVTPRNVRASVGELVSRLNKHVFAPDGGGEGGQVFMSKLDIEFFSSLHANRNKRAFNAVTVDVDEAELFKPVRDELSGMKVWMATKTARGYHIVLDLTSPEHAEAFYMGGTGVWPKIDAKWKGKVELQRDSQEPCPGTLYYLKGDEKNHVRIVE